MNPEQKPKGSWAEFWEKTKEILIQGGVVIAAIFLVILVAWGIIKLVPAIISSVQSGGSSLTSIFKPKESLTVSATPQIATSGTPINFSWKHVSRTAPGTYGISFVCAPGLSMKIRNSAGGYQTVPCGKSFNVGDATGVIFAGTTTQNRLVQTPVTVTFTNTSTGAAGVASEIPVTITNDNLPFTNSTNNASAPVTESETPVKIAKPVSTFVRSGNPDLAISLISATANTIRFQVENRGGVASGSWSFSTNIVGANGQAYSSPVEPSIGAGSGIVFTLSQNASALGGTTITIIPNGADANRANNTLTLGGNDGTGYIYGNGTPDLSVAILSVDGNANSGYQNGYYSGTNGTHTVRVEVTNIGSGTSGSWIYGAQLPISCQNISYNNSYNGNSNVTCNGNQAILAGMTQAPLAAGGSIILTINFTGGGNNNSNCNQNQYPYNGYNSGCVTSGYSGNGAFIFTAQGNFPELSTSNNTATTYVQTY